LLGDPPKYYMEAYYTEDQLDELVEMYERGELQCVASNDDE
jgi:hypothetical protein